MSLIPALVILVVTLPLWVAVSILISIAMFFYHFVKTYFWLFENLFYYELPWADFWGMFVFTPFYSLYKSIVAFFDLPIWIYNFARYDHPWWSLIIAFIVALVFFKWANKNT